MKLKRLSHTLALCFFLLMGMAINAAVASEASCQRLAKSITGLNFHRSDSPELAKGQIWQFGADGKLAAFAAGEKLTKPLANLHWRVEFEDARCVLKVATLKKPDHWTTYRITDTTWAIVKRSDGEEGFVPDFEDHTGIKTRYCGSGERCEKLWK